MWQFENLKMNNWRPDRSPSSPSADPRMDAGNYWDDGYRTRGGNTQLKRYGSNGPEVSGATGAAALDGRWSNGDNQG